MDYLVLDKKNLWGILWKQTQGLFYNAEYISLQRKTDIW